MEKIIQKIKKLMAIANDPSASDQEIQLATHRAEKLILKYKIDQKDIIEKKNKTEEDVSQYTLDKQFPGYFVWTLNAICKYCQCISSYSGKLNSRVYLHITGFPEDVEIAKAMAIPLMEYMSITLSEIKECYIENVDFRIFKREWCYGFSDGIEQQLNNALIEMKSHEKFELAIIDLHPVLKTYQEKHMNSKISQFTIHSLDGYQLGLKDGSSYQFNDSKKILVGYDQ